jgi:hypothetical protein
MSPSRERVTPVIRRFVQQSQSQWQGYGSKFGINQNGMGLQYGYLKDTGNLVFGAEVSYQKQSLDGYGEGIDVATTAIKGWLATTLARR